MKGGDTWGLSIPEVLLGGERCEQDSEKPALLPSPPAWPPAEDPGAEVPAALGLLSVVPHLPAGRVLGHGDTAEYLPRPQPECLGDFTTHGLGCRYMGGAFYLW